MEEGKKIAVITGASSGIGLAISRELASRGCRLLLISNEEEKLNLEASKIESEYNVRAIPLFMDLAEREAAQKIFLYISENKIEVEILVNNAGIFFFRDIKNTPTELTEKAIDLHIYTPTILTQLFIKNRLNSQNQGQSYILNISSIAAWMMMPGIALYCATKSYIRCFSRAVRHEVIDRGISITTVCPGAVATNLYGLTPNLMRLGIRLGIILTPEKLAAKAVKKMFQKKAQYIPAGPLNRFFILAVQSLPPPLVRFIKEKIDKK